MGKRFTALFLAVLTVFICAASCAESPINDDSDSQTDTQTTAEATDTKLQSKLPALNYDGAEIRISYFGYEDSVMFDAVGEFSGDVVTDAVYNRNIKVADQLNVKFNWIVGSDSWEAYPEAIKKSVMSGSDDYDMIFMESSQCFRLSLDGYFKNLASAPYIDYSMPWWYTEFMDEACITPAQRYFVTGAFSLTTMLFASAMFFNKTIYEDHFGNSDELYQKALDKTWTYDELIHLSRAVYTDINGDGEADDGDLMGFYMHGQRTVNYTSMSTGLTYITRDAQGVPVLDLYNDDTLKWVDTLYTMCFDKTVSLSEENVKAFLDSKALFYLMMLSSIKEIRDSDFAWGILPYPTLYEGMEYKSAAGTVNGNSAVIPNTADDTKYEMCCAALEALSYEAYENVVPAWYGIALKNKYSDTEMDSKMVDIIYNSIYCPFIMVTDKYLGLGSFFYNCVYKAKTNAGGYSSYWEKNEKKSIASWDKMIEKYNKMIETNG
jgi:ABC-type sugar transport system, periplasmic component